MRKKVEKITWMLMAGIAGIAETILITWLGTEEAVD